MTKFFFTVITIFLIINSQVKAEYNLVENEDRPTFIEQGYRNILNSYFTYTSIDKKNYQNKNTVKLPHQDISILLNPLLSNNNKIKGESYYFINYQPYFSIKGSSYKLPFIISDVSAIGTSMIFDDSNISIFSIESYVNPVSSNDSKEFKSNIYIVNKKNLGLYNPAFLTIDSQVKNVYEIPRKFSKLASIKYNKNQSMYTIVYEIQQPKENFSSTGKLVYEKTPIEYSFALVLDKKKPFLIKNFVERVKGSNKVTSRNDSGGQYSYFIK